jgi:hypothetical protein
MRIFVALAIGALLLAFATSLTLVMTSGGKQSNQPLVVYGSR